MVQVVDYVEITILSLGILVFIYLLIITDSSNDVLDRYTKGIKRRGIFQAKAHRSFQVLSLIFFTVCLILKLIYYDN